MKDEKLIIKNLSFNYGKKSIIKNINLKIKKGSFVGIIGPNGSGKSTLLKNIYRVLDPMTGEIFLDDEDIFKMKNKILSRKMGVMGQENYTPFDFTVKDMVAMGRNPYKGFFDDNNKIDEDIIEEAIEKTGLNHLKNSYYRELSGGEKQRVIIARVLAQKTDFLILDEPTNHLDINYQLSTLELIKSLNVTVLAAIHDLNIAALYCDYLFVLKDGVIITEGIPNAVLKEDLIKNVFYVDAKIRLDEMTNKVQITYIPNYIKNQGGSLHE